MYWVDAAYVTTDPTNCEAWVRSIFGDARPKIVAWDQDKPATVENIA
jgi:hypothetical protein